MSTPSDTPRTDDVAYEVGRLAAIWKAGALASAEFGELSSADFSSKADAQFGKLRTIERELAATAAERDQLRDKLNATEDALIDGNVKAAATIRENWQLRADLAASEEKAERYRLASLKLESDLAQARQTIEDVATGARE